MICTIPIHEFNPCHNPPGPGGGRFCSTTRVGITSARPRDEAPDRTGHQVLGPHMTDFRDRLSALPGVANVSVQRARGAWNGGREPSWLVSYSGNGAARRLLAETGKRYNQEAVFLYMACHGGNCSPLTDWQLPRITAKTRARIETTLADLGFGGWTWVKGARGTTLRIAFIPQWPTEKIATRADYLRAAGQLSRMLRATVIRVTQTRVPVKVDLLTRETYDAEMGR